MLSFDWQAVLGFVILAGIAWTLWRGGSKNPVGTGSLQRQLNTLGARFGKIELKQADACSKDELEILRGELRSMQTAVASKLDVLGLEGQFHTLEAKVGGVKDTVDDTRAGVRRIEAFLIEKGLGGR